jgi:serine protease Do
MPESPAQKGGLKEGDVIKIFDGNHVRDLKSLLKMVARAKVRSRVKIGIIRDKKPMTVEVEIGERPSQIEEFGKISEKAWRGLEVADISDELVKRFGIRQNEGVVITNVEPNSAAEGAGIIVGDVIDSINKAPVRNMNDYDKITSSLKGDALVRTGRGFAVIKEK